MQDDAASGQAPAGERDAAGGADALDLFVVGGGSGGVRAARVAAGHGARVALAEEHRLGGTCVIRGCVPKKLMVIAARYADALAEAPAFGWRVPAGAAFDWPTLRAALDAEVDRLEGAYGGTLERAGVRVHRARAVAEGRDEAGRVALRLSTGERVVARHVLVATGGHPVAPAIPGIGRAISSNEVFALPAFPARLAVLGGGYIAVEFACLFARLGAEVTLVHRGHAPLRGFDEEVRAALVAGMEAAGIDLRMNAAVEAVEPAEGGGHVVRLAGGGAVPADAVLQALGRAPNTGGLGLEALGARLDPAGAVVVSAAGLAAPGLHAVGDVINRTNLTPYAIREGHLLADRLFGGSQQLYEHGAVPTAVFSTPEIGAVGLTEEEAARLLPAADVFTTAFRPMRATVSGRPERVFMKLVVDAATDRVVGAHVVGEAAAEMVQLLGALLKAGATKAILDATLAVHPTAAEELVTMRQRTRRVGRGAAP